MPLLLCADNTLGSGVLSSECGNVLGGVYVMAKPRHPLVVIQCKQLQLFVTHTAACRRGEFYYTLGSNLMFASKNVKHLEMMDFNSTRGEELRNTFRTSARLQPWQSPALGKVVLP